jgi:hypothetical protein
MKKVLNCLRENLQLTNLILFFVTGLAGILYEIRVPVVLDAEMVNLAQNLASHGTFANPLNSLPTGFTANEPPLYPLILSIFMRVLRLPGLVYIAAVVLSILANACTSLLLLRLSGILFADPLPGIIAALLWIPCSQLIPGWDTNVTVVGILFFCVFAASHLFSGRSDFWKAAVSGLSAGALFLLNPASVLVVVPFALFLLGRARENRLRRAADGVLLLSILFLFIAGWSTRNYVRLGAFVTRTNLGMTLYGANNNCADATFSQSFRSGCYGNFHPNLNKDEAVLLQSVGEVQYDRLRVRDSEKWILAHPGRFLHLTAKRIF